jgi:asparagine synthetase B (glutamine-hydrolysing)
LLDKGRGEARQANARIFAGLERLRRRGPDSQEYWGDNRTPIHLGFARLAIVDTDTRANQPYFIEENRLGIVFNGEIYNYAKLKNDLSKELCVQNIIGYGGNSRSIFRVGIGGADSVAGDVFRRDCRLEKQPSIYFPRPGW